MNFMIWRPKILFLLRLTIDFKDFPLQLYKQTINTNTNIETDLE